MSTRWIIILLMCIGLNASLNAQTKKISIDDLESFLSVNSPYMKGLENEYKTVNSERSIDLQWSNPELGVGYEQVSNNSDTERESVFTLSKTFEMPWVYSKRKDLWDSKIQSASYRKDEMSRSFLAEMKSGYVELKLLEDQKKELERIIELIKSISKTASDQHDEGAISGLEKTMIQMSLVNVESVILEITKQELELEAGWKTLAGIERDKTIDLTTPVKYYPVEIKAESFTNIEENYSGILARKSTSLAMQDEVSVEKMNIFPEISIGGGYKKVGTAYSGFVLDLSFPIPLMNQNGAQSELKQIELEQFENESAQYRETISAKVNTLKKVIKEYQTMLDYSSTDLASNKNVIDKIILSYKEGWISLGDMLTGIEIYTDYIGSSNGQLLNYYRAIFDLETINGKHLVKF